MALRDQPYLPLYVQDFLTDEKLCECSAESTGVYIRLMCLMHKSQEYGTFLLLQNGWQNSGKTPSTCQDFATRLVRHMPYDVDTINRSLEELLRFDVIQIDGNKILQRRMVKDNRISNIRANAGKQGGFAKAKVQQNPSKSLANTENENENENINEKEIEKGVKGEKKERKRRAKTAEIVKSFYGSQNNVALTAEELERLRLKFPEDADDAVEYLSQYIAEKGYRSVSHNLAIQRWVIDTVKERRLKRQGGRKASAYDEIMSLVREGDVK